MGRGMIITASITTALTVGAIGYCAYNLIKPPIDNSRYAQIAEASRELRTQVSNPGGYSLEEKRSELDGMTLLLTEAATELPAKKDELSGIIEDLEKVRNDYTILQDKSIYKGVMEHLYEDTASLIPKEESDMSNYWAGGALALVFGGLFSGMFWSFAEDF